MLVQDERLVRRVGAVSLALLGLAIAFFVFVYDRIEWGAHVRVRVYFHHVGSLRERAAFVAGGRQVGTIETIALSPRGSPGPLGGDEGVVVTVAIDAADAAQLDRGGDVFVASRGALAERYLELGPPPDPGTALREGDQLLGRDPPSLDRVLQRTWDNLTTLGTFAAELKPELDALRAQVDELRGHFGARSETMGGDPAGSAGGAAGNAPRGIDVTAKDLALPSIEKLGPLIIDAGTISDEIRHVREVGLGGEAGMVQLAAVIAHGRAVLAASRASLDKLDASASALRANLESVRGRLGTKGNQAIAAVELAIDRVRDDIAKVDPLLVQIDALNDRIAKGEGTLLKLMHDPEFPEDAKELGRILKRQPWKIINHPSER